VAETNSEEGKMSGHDEGSNGQLPVQTVEQRNAQEQLRLQAQQLGAASSWATHMQSELTFLHQVIKDMRVETRLYGHITYASLKYIYRYPERAQL
jgi:hypothetical protein